MMRNRDIFLILCLLFLYGCPTKKEEILTFSSATEQDSIVDHAIEETVSEEIVIEKEFLYDQHTLEDVYPFKDTSRYFQWDKIVSQLKLLEESQQEPARWGILQNRKNVNGEAPLARNVKRNNYHNMADSFGVERYQSIPLYLLDDLSKPERYSRDGALIKIVAAADSTGFLLIEDVYIGGKWQTPEKYVKPIADSVIRFDKVLFADRTNQNIATLEKVDGKWFVRSMNPVTTGLQNPPYQQATPLGIFVIQEKKRRMYYYADGTTTIAGNSPYASRFSNGGYLHGIPINLPRTATIEFSATLGTTPRSHMCIRNATSHAEFIYNWAPIDQSLVFVIE